MITVETNDIKNIIRYLETSQKSYHQSLLCVKRGDYQEAQKYYNSANDFLLQAHRIHAELLSCDISVTMSLIYAQDLLMSVQMYKILIKEIMDVYKVI